MAHSLLCAITLVRETLPPGALHDDAWAQLVSAAITLSIDAKVPPSTQPATVTTGAPAHSSPSRRTLSPPPSASSRKRRQREATTPEPTPPRSKEPQPTSPSPAPPAPQELIIKVSNNNRRTAQDREKKHAATTAHRKRSIRLLEPAAYDTAEEKITYHKLQPADYANIA
ncbi:hypothetical protein DPSP01_014495 [Paraphaeosphaeria sporulosa]